MYILFFKKIMDGAGLKSFVKDVTKAASTEISGYRDYANDIYKNAKIIETEFATYVKDPGHPTKKLKEAIRRVDIELERDRFERMMEMRKTAAKSDVHDKVFRQALNILETKFIRPAENRMDEYKYWAGILDARTLGAQTRIPTASAHLGELQI